MTFLKDDAELQKVQLGMTVQLNKASASVQVYNRLGQLMEIIAKRNDIELAVVIAVWLVESGGRIHKANRAIIRFENHLLRRQLNSDVLYKQNFIDDGCPPKSGKSWQGHFWRVVPTANWQKVHKDQISEYDVLTFARSRYGDDIAMQCISIGGPQILVSNYKVIGYKTPAEMFDAFQKSERAHVLGFFDFCQHSIKNGLKLLRDKQFREFARSYNGPGNAEEYGRKINQSYELTKTALRDVG